MTTNRDSVDETTLSSEELAELDAWWRAANYLSAAQIYLLANPLLRQPLRLERAGLRQCPLTGPHLPSRLRNLLVLSCH